MKFTVIMASDLRHYPGAARQRDKKIVRAVNSILSQSYDDFEIVVVADGCQKTIDIMSEYNDYRIRTFKIPKGKMWSGGPRNKGLLEAQGEYITYLDNDDQFGENHLKDIEVSLGDYDWVWFDDIRYEPRGQRWYQNACDVARIGRCGTSNICHKPLDVHWDHDGYAHDYYFIMQLRNYKNFARIDAGEYYVCHLPGAGGYDL